MTDQAKQQPAPDRAPPARLTEYAPAHPRAIRAIEHALRTKRLHHAYILAGADSGGSRALAQALGQRLACSTRRDEQNTGPEHIELDACQTCTSCRSYVAQSYSDLFTVEPNEKGAIPIDPIRSLASRLSRKSSTGATKIVHIFQADRMNPAAQNALLKTLEEPSGDTCFLLTATRPRSLLLTVRSRCQRLQLNSADWSSAERALLEGGVEPTLAKELAPLLGTDVQRALAMQDSGAGEIIRQLEQALGQPDDIGLALNAAKELGADRERADLALSFLELRVRNALAERHGAEPSEHRARADWHPSATSLRELVGILQHARRLKNRSLNRTLLWESILFTIARADRLGDVT